MEILIVATLIGLLPAYIAHLKGRPFVLWWIYGALLFIVALPHALMLEAVYTEDDVRKELKRRQSEERKKPEVEEGSRPLTGPIDFIADGVIQGRPYRVQPDGGVVALLGGRVVKFKSMADLKAALEQPQA